jgi:hypothetical protein
MRSGSRELQDKLPTVRTNTSAVVELHEAEAVAISGTSPKAAIWMLQRGCRVGHLVKGVS